MVLSDLGADSRRPLPLQLRITAQVGFFRHCRLHSNLRASLKYWCIDPGIPRGPAGPGREQAGRKLWEGRGSFNWKGCVGACALQSEAQWRDGIVGKVPVIILRIQLFVFLQSASTVVATVVGVLFPDWRRGSLRPTPCSALCTPWALRGPWWDG